MLLEVAALAVAQTFGETLSTTNTPALFVMGKLFVADKTAELADKASLAKIA